VGSLSACCVREAVYLLQLANSHLHLPPLVHLPSSLAPLHCMHVPSKSSPSVACPPARSPRPSALCALLTLSLLLGSPSRNTYSSLVSSTMQPGDFSSCALCLVWSGLVCSSLLFDLLCWPPRFSVTRAAHPSIVRLPLRVGSLLPFLSVFRRHLHCPLPHFPRHLLDLPLSCAPFPLPQLRNLFNHRIDSSSTVDMHSGPLSSL